LELAPLHDGRLALNTVPRAEKYKILL